MSSTPPGSDSDFSLDTGLAALKQGDTETAIAQFEGICRTSSRQKDRLRAQMGLVTAYRRRGDTARSLQLCQQLCQAKSEKVRQWALHQLGNWGIRDLGGQGDKTSDLKPQTSHLEPQTSHLTPQTSHLEPRTSHLTPRRPRKALRKANLARLGWVQVISLVVLVVWLNLLFHGWMTATNTVLLRLRWLGADPIQPFFQDQTTILLVAIAVVFVAAPWLLDALLRWLYGAKPLSMVKFKAESPEAAKVLRQVCRQRNIPLPKLTIVPESTPLALTYGHLPRTATVTISQGLLDRLEDDEIASIIAAELGHILRWEFVPMTLAVTIAQIPYTIYWQSARGGDWIERFRQNHRGSIWIDRALMVAIYLATGVSGIAYGVWWLFRFPILWLSRSRLAYSDRFAAEATGDPNSLARALVKIAIATAENVRKCAQNSYLVESFAPLLPVSCQQAIVLANLSSVETALNWDLESPYRQWLSVGNTHPTLGDRLYLLSRYAQFWEMEPEFHLSDPTATPRKFWQTHPKLWLQSAPFLGVVLGGIVGVSFAIVGWAGKLFDFSAVSWLYYDRPWLTSGLILAGFAIGTLVRINTFFPDIKPYTLAATPDLPGWSREPKALPLDRHPARLSGKLLGRQGIGNRWGQDLILQTEEDGFLLKLHFCSRWGVGGNILAKPHLDRLVGRSVTVTGWFRRGATLWFDVETLEAKPKVYLKGGHPIWSTILMGIAGLWGSYLLWRGGIW